MARRRVEVLILEGCPNENVAVDRVRAAMSGAAIDAELRIVLVKTEDEAQRLRFLGSPSVRIDGLDVEVSARPRSDFGLQCRIYTLAGRILGTPPTEWIADALRVGAQVDDTG